MENRDVCQNGTLQRNNLNEVCFLFGMNILPFLRKSLQRCISSRTHCSHHFLPLAAIPLMGAFICFKKQRKKVLEIRTAFPFQEFKVQRVIFFERSLDKVISHKHKHPHLHPCSFLMVDVKEFRIQGLNMAFQSLHKSVLLSGHLCALAFPNWFWP